MGRDLVTEILFTNEKVHFIKNVIALVVVFKAVGKCLQQLYNRGFVGLAKEWKVYLIARTFRLLKKLPFVQARIKKETGEIFEKMEKDVAPKKEGEPRFLELPSEGFKPEEVNKLLQTYDGMTHMDVMSGMASGTVYHGMPELTAVVHEAYKKFSFSNPLHPDVFPGVRKMEAEVVAMVVKMFNGGPTACGTTTSGGTESILMACKAMRDWALDVKGITEPEMVVPVSAHAAFDKAAHYFGIKIIHAPVDDVTRKVDVRAVRRMVTSNTIMIVGSAPGFPHGVIDDIESLAKIAKRWNIGLHVDSCLGGFLVPFMEEAGFPLPLFDFRVDGVTSISCDTHKYGFAPKGSSVVLYSKPEYRHHQYFVAPDWPGGIYASPTIAGSRPGALIAACWAAMMFMGRKGYVESARRIVQTARNIVAGLKKVPGLKVFGEPLVSVVAFGSDEFDIYLLGEKLTKEGWNLNSLQYPPSIHICCTQLTPKVEKKFIDDVTRFAAEIMAGPRDAKTGGMAAIYGMAASLPDRSLVDYMARGFIDCLYSA